LVLAQANPDVIILPNGHPLLQLLEKDASWQQFSRDSVATVLTRVGFAP
jgi:ABC-type Fe3+-hydroxamate transport system substrate-binding protein